jgi:hypothetical protein
MHNKKLDVIVLIETGLENEIFEGGEKCSGVTKHSNTVPVEGGQEG